MNGELILDRELAQAYTKELYTRSIHPVGVAYNHIRCQESLHDLSDELGKITVPGLFVHGEKDPLISVKGAIQTAKAAFSSKLVIIPKMGHMFFNKRAQQNIAELLLSHFCDTGSVMRDQVRVVPYDPAWPKLFEQESNS